MQKIWIDFYRFWTKYSDKVFDIVNTCIIIILFFVFAWPLWFVVIASFSDPDLVNAGKVLFIPKGITLEAYEKIIALKYIWKSYYNTIVYTLTGTIVNVVMTICAAYPLSRSDFKARKICMVMLVITMYFSGGLIPSYLVVKGLGMINTIWAMIIPSACSVYNVLVTRTYFRSSIPSVLNDAACIDGANAYQYLMKIVLPLSKPVISVITLYYMVGHWNDYYTALVYITDRDKKPLQNILRDILMTANALMNSMEMQQMNIELAKRMQELAMSLRYTTIIVATVPVVVAYLFVQKHFEKGVMIGSVKG